MASFLGIVLFGSDRANKLETLREDAKTQSFELAENTKILQDALKEQNEYVLEIEDLQEEFQLLQKESEQELNSTLDRYLTLKNKELEGTITEEEQKELENLENERNNYINQTNNQKANLSGNINTTKQSYNGTDNIIANVSSIIQTTNSTINGLHDWNSDVKSEYGEDSKIRNRIMDDNVNIANNLSKQIDKAEPKLKRYSQQYNFLKK